MLQTEEQVEANKLTLWPQTLTFVDLFCGAGLLTQGLEASGMKHLLGVELDPFAVRTYAANFDRKVIEMDLSRADAHTQIKLNISEKPDVVVGGPPCQGFSTAGKRDPNDVRSEMVVHFVRVATNLQPRFIVMENVPGIVSMDNGQIVKDIQFDLKVAGYHSRWSILRSSDYGAATTRKRFVLFAWRDGEPEPPEPMRTHMDPGGGGLLIWHPVNTVGDVLFKTPAGTLPEPPEGFPNAHVPTKHKPKTVELMREQQWGEALYSSWSHSWVRLNPNKPAPTLKENHGAVAVHPTQDRVITPREMARLQGLPDTFDILGPKSQQLKQVGNGVPTFLGRAIGDALGRRSKP